MKRKGIAWIGLVVAAVWLGTTGFVGSLCAAPEGFALYLSLDENKGNEAADLSGNNHTASFVGNPQWVAGKRGFALELDGQSYLEVADTPKSGFDNVSALTIELWAKQATHHDNGLVVKLTTAAFWPCSYNLETWSDSNIWFGVEQDGMAISAGGYPLNEWFHLAAVFDGKSKTQHVYLNGKKVAEGPTPTDTVPDGDNPVWIGTVDPTHYQFKGSIDDVAIYSRALTATEIQADMSGIALSVAPQGKLATRWASLKESR